MSHIIEKLDADEREEMVDVEQEMEEDGAEQEGAASEGKTHFQDSDER